MFLTQLAGICVPQGDIFGCFPRGGCFAAMATEVADVLIYDTARVVTTVTSHATGFPFHRGTRVRPSGRLPLVQKRPDGSFIAGILSEEKAWETMSLRA